MDKKIAGFTLLEMIIVLIILAILSVVGGSQFFLIIEKSRSAEPKMQLGQLRKAEMLYYMDQGTYTPNISELSINSALPSDCSQVTHFFSYSIPTATAAAFTLRADRCTSGGKPPSGPNYYISLDSTDTWSGTPGYY